MRLLIIDDEAVFQQKIKERLTAFFAAENVAAEIDVCGDPAAVKEKGLYRSCDVLLLDIEMPALSGLDLAAAINKQRGGSEKPYIIFVTNRDELVFDALKLQPFSFVRKGHLEDAEPCLRRILERLRREDFIVIHTGRGTQRLHLNEILCLEKIKNYVVYRKERGEFRERATIDEKERALAEKGFLRPHIGYLVNARHIDSLQTETVVLTDGTQIPVSRKYRQTFRQKHFEWVVNAP